MLANTNMGAPSQILNNIPIFLSRTYRMIEVTPSVIVEPRKPSSGALVRRWPRIHNRGPWTPLKRNLSNLFQALQLWLFCSAAEHVWLQEVKEVWRRACVLASLFPEKFYVWGCGYFRELLQRIKRKHKDKPRNVESSSPTLAITNES